MLLTKEQRAIVPLISKTLADAKERAKSASVSEIRKWVINSINKNPLLKVEYFDVVNDTNLDTINDWDDEGNKIGCIAVHVGSIRLIDNIRFYS